jgi:hypothetical protein
MAPETRRPSAPVIKASKAPAARACSTARTFSIRLRCLTPASAGLSPSRADATTIDTPSYMDSGSGAASQSDNIRRGSSLPSGA